MKQVLISIVLMLTLGLNAGATSQSHRHQPRTALTDSAQTNNDAIEAFSDTTGSATSDTTYTVMKRTVNLDDEEAEEVARSVLKAFWDEADVTALGGMLLVLLIVFTIFFLLPIGILLVIFYFVRKNRKDKIRLAEMAMKNGQPIPEQLLNEKKSDDGLGDGDEYQKGLRQCFIGIGLAIFLGYAAGNVGFGIGMLVFCIGLGKVVAARTSRKKDDINPPSNNV
ncbi:MAG: DUF6249 domain-containing protein [Prevotella sp.]|nr:DUF6249 domain-containing protein [Prevotella sp.]